MLVKVENTVALAALALLALAAIVFHEPAAEAPPDPYRRYCDNTFQPCPVEDIRPKGRS